MKVVKFAFVLSILLLLLASVPAQASTVTFATRAAFDAVAPGLSVETFESGLVAAGGLTSCASPLSSAASACFPAGGLLPGVTYTASPAGQFVVLGAGFQTVGNTSKVLGPSLFADTLTLTFAGPITAAGFDVYPGLAAGTVSVSLFAPGGASLGTFTFSAAIGPSFFGVISTDQIGSINIASTTAAGAAGGELIDNLAFGQPTTVSEPSAFVLLTGGLAMLFGWRRKRR